VSLFSFLRRLNFSCALVQKSIRDPPNPKKCHDFPPALIATSAPEKSHGYF
jgi:hypothetical protein